jgi:crotonobetaine/carnitine-CoA ligase
VAASRSRSPLAPPRGPAPPRLAAPSLGRLLRDRAARSPDRFFLRYEGSRLTFREAWTQSARVANALGALGIVKGDRVGIMLPNGLEYPITWLGIVSLGAVVVPINVNYRDADLSYVLADSGARVVVALAEFVPILESVRARCRAVERLAVWDAPPHAEVVDFRAAVAAAGDGLDVDGLGPGDLSVLQYTSGTTGFPKGCMLPHEMWLRAGGNAAEAGGFTEDDVVLIMTAFYYGDAGWNMALCLIAGAELVILPRFSATTLWRSVRESGATFFYCLGSMPVMLMKQPEDPAVDRGHKLRFVSCSGIPRDAHAAIERRWGVRWREVYGTTEIGGPLMARLEDTETVGSGSVGRLVAGYEARLVDPSGREVGVGPVGELYVKGPSLSLGYWNNPDATAAWMRDGWAATGDLMRRDHRGFYYLVGRTKDMIRRGGENIAAAEVEAILCQHPAVRNAACVAVLDEIRGEEVKAFVELQPGATPETAAPPAILGFCGERLARFKVPRYLAYVGEFSLTPSQRIEKHRLSREPTDCWDGVTGGWR